MDNTRARYSGLTTEEATRLQELFGRNELHPEPKSSAWRKLLHIVCEPMFMLLLVAAVIYFLLGEPRDGAIMLIFVVGVISIDVIQEWKTDKTLKALCDLSAPRVKVIRDGHEQEIASADLVPGDLLLICEGSKIPADGVILQCNDLCIDESSLTGESEGVWKRSTDPGQVNDDYWRQDYCYAGTLVIQGSASIRVEKIGVDTEYGKIGVAVGEAPLEATPLQRQTASLVKLCAWIALFLCLFVAIITFINFDAVAFEDRLVGSVLSGITLAMAMIPEEFPVILTVFLSMGAWRLAKKNSLIRNLPSAETLGSISVLCVDKTGTITMNQMQVQKTWSPENDLAQLCLIMGLACESDAYDPMEKAMLSYCEQMGLECKELFRHQLIQEYPFTNELKMMGHVWQMDDGIMVAAKGSPERLLQLCDLTEAEQSKTEEKMLAMSQSGLRVIAVGQQKIESSQEIPADINSCQLHFLGLIGLADPPREHIQEDIRTCAKAGVRVVMITGDNGSTAAAIAKQVGIRGWNQVLTGDMLDKMSDEELCEAVKTVNIFSRVIPEHKMRIVRAFQKNGNIVAMTGDGVNDAPALKYADIGIAMGKRGSEVAREAADLVLMDDNFSTIVDTIRDGRRIYDNIRKAVGYVFTIHIPIALSSLLAPMLGITAPALMLLPLHVMLLELIIDPTCSIVLERQPAEDDIMERPPRAPQAKILTASLLLKSVIQGVIIFAVSFGAYFIALAGDPANAPLARSLGLAIIMLANLFLVQVNSSQHSFAITTAKRLIHDKVMWAVNILTIAGLVVILYSPLNSFLKLAPLSFGQLLCAIGLAAGSVLWYELVKVYQQAKLRKDKKITDMAINN